MDIISINLTLDLTDRCEQVVYCNQYENNSRQLVCSIQNEGTDYTIPTGATVAVRMTKSTGRGVEKTIGVDSFGSVSGSTITFPLISTMTSANGRSVCDLNIYDTDGSVYTTTFILKVRESALDENAVIDTNDYSTFAEMTASATASATSALEAKEIAVTKAEEAASSASDCLTLKDTCSELATTVNTAKEDALASKQSAQQSAQDAQNSKENAQTSATNASASETKANEYKDTTYDYIQQAIEQANNASNSATTSTEKAELSQEYANASSASAVSAQTSATHAATSATNANTSAELASEKASEIETTATLSESYAKGGTSTREGEETDNAKYYYQQAKQISQGLNGLLPMGTIAFSDLALQPKHSGYMFNISDEFVSDATFKDGGNIKYPAGTNIYYTADGYWDCLANSLVAGVKGDAETNYQQGFVNLTPDNIGSYDKDSVDKFISGLNSIMDSIISRVTELEDLSGFAHLVDDSGMELVTSDNDIIILSV